MDPAAVAAADAELAPVQAEAPDQQVPGNGDFQQRQHQQQPQEQLHASAGGNGVGDVNMSTSASGGVVGVELGSASAPPASAPAPIASANTSATTNTTTLPNGERAVIGSAHIRPVFLGNLDLGVTTEEVADLFTHPAMDIPPMSIDRIDVKRGFAFVFLNDVKSEDEKERISRYVDGLSGMDFPKITRSMRAEFARGDGRIKRKEDDRRKDISPNETLFVVNFSEETTKREDLEMLFSPFGELVRIDMKKNYAFVQFTNVEDSIKAKDATNGGKLDQSVITVEFVAAKRRDRDDYRDRSGGDRGGYRGRRDRDDYRDRGGGDRGGYRGKRDDNRGGYRGRRDDRDRDDRRYGDDRRRSPPRGRRDRSRSRSPPPYRGGNRSRSRSPPVRRGDRDDNRGGGGRYNDSSRDGGRDNRGYR